MGTDQIKLSPLDEIREEVMMLTRILVEIREECEQHEGVQTSIEEVRRSYKDL